MLDEQYALVRSMCVNEKKVQDRGAKVAGRDLINWMWGGRVHRPDPVGVNAEQGEVKTRTLRGDPSALLRASGGGTRC